MKALRITNLSKTYHKNQGAVINRINLHAVEGEILALVGESGSGKSTLLRIIAGLERPDTGTIEVKGKIMVDENQFIEPENRNIGLVFQQHALFPHLNILDNVGFGLKKLSKSQRLQRIDEVLDLVELKDIKNRYPHQLSGGQQQRIALARALAPRPGLLLLDEPFSNLDNVLKDKVREEVKQILKNAKVTVIFVTHDTKDALLTADKIALIDNGKLLQWGSPADIYHAPIHEKVARFFGLVNSVLVEANETGCLSEVGPLQFQLPPLAKKGQLIIRPENIILSESDNSSLYGTLRSKSYLGDHMLLHLSIATSQGKTISFVIKAKSDDQHHIGEHIYFDINFKKIHFLPL